MDKECDKDCIAYNHNQCKRLKIISDINTNLSYIRKNMETLINIKRID